MCFRRDVFFKLVAITFLSLLCCASWSYPQEVQDVTNPEQTQEITNSIGMEFRLIPSGTFMMGASPGANVPYYEKAIHQVEISKAFYMGMTEVTQAQWKAVMGKNPSRRKDDNLPVEKVSWADAVEFCSKLSEIEGEIYRLPTEAEWEYACRAGTETMYYWGNAAADAVDYAWFDDNSSKPHQVGTKLPNAWGLYDISGNVFEWCSDWYEEWGSDLYGDYQSGLVTDPTGPSEGYKRIVRGGSYVFGPQRLRSCARSCTKPADFTDYIGFRVVKEIKASLISSTKLASTEEESASTNLSKDVELPLLSPPSISVADSLSEIEFLIETVARALVKDVDVNNTMPGLMPVIRAVDSSLDDDFTGKFVSDFGINNDELWIALKVSIKNPGKLDISIPVNKLILNPVASGIVDTFQPVGIIEGKSALLGSMSTIYLDIEAGRAVTRILLYLLEPEAISMDEFTLSLQR